MKTLIHLETSKWAATSPHVSQSSPVTLYMLTNPLISFAMVGVALVPGDKEYRMGRLSFCRTWTSDLHISSSSLFGKDWSIKFMHQKVMYTSDTNVISSTSKSSPNTQSCFTANKREKRTSKLLKQRKTDMKPLRKCNGINNRRKDWNVRNSQFCNKCESNFLIPGLIYSSKQTKLFVTSSGLNSI